MEKRRIKAGDKTLLFKRLGIAEDEDIDRIKKRFGLKDVEEDDISGELQSKTNIGRKRSRYKLAKEQSVKDDLVDMISDRQAKQEALEDMREDEIIEMEKRQALVKGMFRDDNIGYSPIIIKAA